MAFANRSPLDPAELDVALAGKEPVGVQAAVNSIAQSDTAQSALITQLRADVTALQAAIGSGGPSAPAISTAPALSIVSPNLDVNDQPTISDGTYASGTVSTRQREIWVSNLLKTTLPVGLAQVTIDPAWGSTSAEVPIFVVEIATFSSPSGVTVRNQSLTTTINQIPAVPSSTGQPSLTGVAGTTLTRGHTTWTQGPILDYKGRFYINGAAGPDQVTCTISNASPAVVTEATHGRAIGDQIEFGTSGGLPTGLTVGTTCFIISAGFGGSAYQVSLTSGGAAINTSSAGSGTHKVIGTTINSAAYPGANAPGITYREQPTNATGQAVSYAESSAVIIPGTSTGTLTEAHSTAGTETAVNLTTEGVKDWYLFVDDAQTTQIKSGGVGGITVTAGGGGFLTSDGTSEYGRNHSWTDGTPTASGSGAGGGKILWGGAGSYVDITIPSGTTASDRHRLRAWSNETPADTWEVSATWSDGSASIATYQFANSGQGLMDFIGGPNNSSATLNTRVKNITGNGGIVLESITVVAQTGGGGGGGAGTVPAPTVALDARIPFANYVGAFQPLSGGEITVQFDGAFFPELRSCPESGGFAPFSGSVLGNAMRFGKMTDPLTGKVCFRCAMRSTDPKESGNSDAQRVDLVMPATGRMSQGVIYWDAWDVIFPNHTYLAQQQLALFDIHPGGAVGAVGLVFINGSLFNVCQPPSGGNRYTAISQTNAPYDTRLKIVRQMLLSGTSSGFCNIWIDKGAGLVLAAADTGANMVAGDTGAYSKCAFYFSSVGGIDPARPEQEIRWFTQLSPIADAGHTKEQIAAMLTA